MANNDMSNLFSKAFRKTTRMIQRAHNQRKAYVYPSSANGVESHPSPVLGDIVTGSMFDPCVISSPDGRYAMYVSCRRNGTIERWDSVDGLAWKKVGVCLSGRNDFSSWDSMVNRACVMQEGSRWLMWFTGQCNGKSAIGLASSVDGINFSRLTSSPVIVPTSSYEGVSVMNPCVLKLDDGLFHMWYSAGEDYEPDVICKAVSVDGVHWEKSPFPALSKGTEPYDSYKVGGCSVLNVDEHHLAMFYIGYQNLDVARICLAISNDGGQVWKRSKANPLVGPCRHAWNAHSVYKPSALLLPDGSARLWYNARRKKDEFIGTASICNVRDLFVCSDY